MGIQSAFNQVLGTAAALKTIGNRNKEEAAKVQQKAQYQKMGNKLMMMYDRAKEKAMQEAEVRGIQKQGFIKLKEGLFR